MNSSAICYRQPGYFSDIHDVKIAWEELPKDIHFLFRLTQSMIIHENECQWGNYDFAKNRYAETNIRQVSSMLKRFFELSDQPLTIERPIEKRLIASCRGASLLFAALLRAFNIPARLKIGFVTYHPIASFYMDHVVVEYFDPTHHQWRWADPLLTEEHMEKNPKTQKLNPLALKSGQFIPAEQAWKSVRCGEVSADAYGIGLFKNRRGLFAIRNKLMHEIAARLKYEMLPGDLWGYMLFDGPQVEPQDTAQLAVMDRLADVLMENQLADIQHFYRTHNAIKIPSIVINNHSILGTCADEIGNLL